MSWLFHNWIIHSYPHITPCFKVYFFWYLQNPSNFLIYARTISFPDFTFNLSPSFPPSILRIQWEGGQTPDLSTPWSCTFQPPELWEICFYYWSYLVYGIYCSSHNWLRQELIHKHGKCSGFCKRFGGRRILGW